MPTTRPSANTSSSTTNPSLSSAPASTAALTSTPSRAPPAWTEADRHAVDDQLVPGEREVAEID
jgi:hypothetical protein